MNDQYTINIPTAANLRLISDPLIARARMFCVSQILEKFKLYIEEIQKNPRFYYANNIESNLEKFIYKNPPIFGDPDVFCQILRLYLIDYSVKLFYSGEDISHIEISWYKIEEDKQTFFNKVFNFFKKKCLKIK